MKLRIRGNTLRLRLTQPEVAAIAAGDDVSEHCAIGTSGGFSYRLCADPNADGIAADYADNRITVTLPTAAVSRWAASDDVSIAATLAQPGGSLAILVEKDFACLTERPGEDDSDAFPHPERRR